MHTEWLSSIPELRERNWDLLTRNGDLFRCCDWLEITASSDPDLAEPPRYLMVLDDGGRPLAASPIYIQTAGAIPDPLVRVDIVLREALSRGDEPRDWCTDLMPGMVCGGWAPTDSRLLLAPGPLAEAALGMALDELIRFSGERDAASMAFLYVDSANRSLRRALSERGFLVFPAPPRAVLSTPWRDFSGYLDSLRTSRRQSVRSDERRLAEAGVTFELSEFAPADVSTFARLATATASKYEPEASEPEMERWLATMQQQAYFKTVVVRAKLDGRLCGYLLLVEWRGVLYPQHGGFDYELKGKLPVYFSVVFYQTVRYAMRRGIHRIEYSLGSGDVKESRGCAMHQQWSFARAMNPDVHAALTKCLGE
jgi:hypothetical protein